MVSFRLIRSLSRAFFAPFACSYTRRRGLRIVRDDFSCFAANAVSHSLRRSSFQNQNRTGASCLVDNFGIPLCLVLILYWKAASLVERLAKNPASPFGPAGFCATGIRIMPESPGGAFIDQFKNWSIPLFLFRLPRGGKEMHANPLQCAKENRSILYELDGFWYFLSKLQKRCRWLVAQKSHRECTRMSFSGPPVNAEARTVIGIAANTKMDRSADPLGKCLAFIENRYAPEP